MTGFPAPRERQCCDAVEDRWPSRDPAPPVVTPVRGFGGDGADAVATEKDLKMSHSKAHTKTKHARAKSRAKQPSKPGTLLVFEPKRNQAGGCPHPAETAQKGQRSPRS